ncbi:MAG: glycosyltransferase family 2 protein [Pseudobdellovibrionaceae bacterium]|nr:MAG: glycosyltransferase family 2 protein [Pseudobdellovibrionaceae bacterium]
MVQPSRGPKISVIIPTYNRRHTLERALASVWNQSYSPYEVIVVDDGSTDDTDLWLSQWDPEKVLSFRTPNQGVSAARNRAIRASKGEWLAFLDSDDEWHPEKLEKQVEVLLSKAMRPLIHTNENWIRNGTPLAQKSKHKKSGGRIYTQCLPLCCISPSTALIHRTVFDDVGLFDEQFRVCEDYELWLRICSKYEVAYIEEPLITKYGGHADQLSHLYVAMDYWRLRALEKHLNSPFLSQDEQRETWKTYIKKHRILLAGYRKHGTGSCHALQSGNLRATTPRPDFIHKSTL